MRPPEPRGHRHDTLPWWVELFAVTDDSRIRLACPFRCDTEEQAKRQAELLLNLHRGRFDQPDLCFVATIGRPYLERYTAYLVDATASVDWEGVPGHG